MNVLYFADTRFPIERANGAQTMATCRAMAERGHAVTLVVRPDSTQPARDPFAFYSWPAPDDATRGRLRFEVIAATGGARRRRIQFLLGALGTIAGDPQAVVFTRDLGLAAFLLQMRSFRRPRLIYESHGVSAVVSAEQPRLLGNPDLVPTAAKLRRLDRRERRVWRHAAAVVTLTQALADDLAARHGARTNVFVAPDAARPVDDAAMTGMAASDPMLAAYAGHLYPWKGVDVFIEALAHAPGVRARIVGGHPREADRARIEAVVDRCGVRARVEITGHVPQGDVARRLADASMLVLPNVPSAISERYTSPLKLFEYLALGRAIVASDTAAIREVLTPDTTAVLVPPGDAPALGAALSRLAASPSRAAALGAAALTLSRSFTWARRAERLEPALEAAAHR